MKNNMEAKIGEQLTVKQSSGLTRVGTIADEDLDSAASSPSPGLACTDASSGSEPSVESVQNLRII